MLHTERLTLRGWREDDAEAYAAIHAEPEVAYWLGGRLTLAQALASFGTLKRRVDEDGWGMLAVERKEDGALLGVAGLQPIAEDMPPAPGFEASWRLAPAAWGQGYITEAMRAVLADAFQRHALPEIVSFTAASNTRSQAVMARLGFVRDPNGDFDHPRLAAQHSLRPHVVYRLRRHSDERRA